MLNRFSKEHHIRRPSEFKSVYVERKRFFGLFYIAYFRQNQLSYPRLGVVASKRNLRLAVSRNRVKRVAREVFRHRKKALAGWDLVITAKRQAGEATQGELEACLINLMSRVKKQLN